MAEAVPACEVADGCGGPAALAPLAPSPDGPLTVQVRCRAGRRGRTVRHPVVLDPDWTVRTPHDLDLERIAVALGGERISCLDLAECETPALRELVQVRARRVLPGIVRTRNGEWAARAPVPRCRCRDLHAQSAAAGAEHLRSVQHAGFRGGCAPDRLGPLLAAVERAHDTTWARPPADEWGAARCVREHDGLARLWDIGIHPHLVAEIHRRIWPDGPPMPSWFFVGAATRRPDLRWLGETLRSAPDPAVAVWLAWTADEGDVDAPARRGELLRAGISRPAIAALAAANYTTTDVARLATYSSRSIPRAGQVLAAWHRAGCRPSVEDLLALDRLDVDPWYEPTRRAVDSLCALLPPSTGLSRTEVALILAACGTRSGAARAIILGGHDPSSALTILEAHR